MSIAGNAIEHPKQRMKLKAGESLSYKIQKGCHILYERPKDLGAGSWHARYYDSESRKQKKARIGTADDLMTADNLLCFSFDQAKTKAEEFFKVAAVDIELAVTGVSVKKGPYLVKDAIDDYIEALKRDGKATWKNTQTMAYAKIIPELGDIRVARLTKERVELWRTKQAEQPIINRKMIGGVLKEMWRKEMVTEDDVRKRKYSANHVVVLLKTALWRAINSGKAVMNTWQNAEGYKGVKGVRHRFLSITEQQKLVEACRPEFKPLVKGALFTGARYSELARLVVSDFLPDKKLIRFGPFGKVKGRVRYVILSDEAVSFFARIVEGKDYGDAIFTRTTKRHFFRRDECLDNGRWAESDQVYYMKLAVDEAKISPPITFHGLRHTYASMLVNSGCPLSYVASQLGHSNTKMVELHYGHLCPDAKYEFIRNNVPVLGIDKE